MNRSQRNQQIVLEYSDEDIARMKADGIDDDAIPAPGKHTFRRVSPNRVFSRKESKARINIYIDLDVLDHFRKRAERPNSAPYQTQINAELRSIMERDLAREKAEISSTARELLEDDEFLKALSKKLKEKKLQAI